MFVWLVLKDFGCWRLCLLCRWLFPDHSIPVGSLVLLLVDWESKPFPSSQQLYLFPLAPQFSCSISDLDLFGLPLLAVLSGPLAVLLAACSRDMSLGSGVGDSVRIPWGLEEMYTGQKKGS